ncbi:MAG: oxidoreductase [Mycobacteriales bacterium]
MPFVVLQDLESLPGVGEAVARARAAVDRLLTHRLLRGRSAEISAEAALRTARASAALEGCDRPLAEVRRGVADPLVQGALRVAAAAGELRPVLRRAPLQVLARLHVLAAAGSCPPEELGRPVAAEPAAVARLAALAELLAGAPPGAPALVLAAIGHAEVGVLAPFRGGNGLVARGLARLVLIERGLDPKAVLPVDVGHAADPAGYRAGLAGYARGDVSGWLRHCASAVELAAQDGLAACEALARATP